MGDLPYGGDLVKAQTALRMLLDASMFGSFPGFLRKPDSPKTTAMANAIGRVQQQRQSDGRPFRFEPFRTAKD